MWAMIPMLRVLARGNCRISVGSAMGIPSARPREADEPADGEGGGPAGPHFDGDLVGGTAHPAALDLELGPDVVHRPFDGGDGLRPRLVLDDVEGVVDDAFGQAALAPGEHLV